MANNEAQLGLATTEELIREVIVRLTIPLRDFEGYGGTVAAIELAVLLGSLSPTSREYRTIRPLRTATVDITARTRRFRNGPASAGSPAPSLVCVPVENHPPG